MLSSGESSPPRDQTHVSCIAGGFFTTEPLGKPIYIDLYKFQLYRYIYIYTHICTDKYICTTETNNIVNQLYFNENILKIKK